MQVYRLPDLVKEACSFWPFFCSISPFLFEKSYRRNETDIEKSILYKLLLTFISTI